MHKLKINYFIAPIMFISVCSISLVCASFNQNMTIDGEAYVRIEKDVRIMRIEKVSSTNGGTLNANPKYSESATITYDELPNLDSSVTYRITIQNNTNYFQNVSLNRDAVKDNFAYEINYGTLNSTYGSELINPNTTAYIEITIKYDSSLTTLPDDKIAITTLVFDFGPIYARQLIYSNPTYTECETVQCALDEIAGMIS